MDPKTFSGELKRRNVYKVAVTYAVVAWLVFEIASVLLHYAQKPAWIPNLLLVLLALGFVIIVFISWAFEATPEGMKRTEDVSPEEIRGLPSWSTRKFTLFIITTALLAACFLLLDRLQTKLTSSSSAAGPEIRNSR